MTEFVGVCEHHSKEIPDKMIDGEVIIISKMNETGRKLGYNTCGIEQGQPPTKCGNKANFIIERGFPIQA